MAVRLQAHIKTTPDAWRVYETMSMPLDGTGEHAWFYVEKESLNTLEVARALADACSVPEVQVGYAGLKDRNAITRQWFSVPRSEDDWPLQHAQVRCLCAGRHSRKLRRGQHGGNDFELRLVFGGCESQREAVAAAVQALDGAFPNYFGPQRVSADNIAQARAWLSQRARLREDRPSRNRRGRGRYQRKGTGRRGWHLSVLRSELFNAVLKLRVEQDSYSKRISGDVLEQGVPTGPLWGRGRSRACAEAAAVEQAALAPYAEICDGLEFAGVNQGRRKLAVQADNFSCEALADMSWRVRFHLPPGAYATTLLAHRFDIVDDSKTYA